MRPISLWRCAGDERLWWHDGFDRLVADYRSDSGMTSTPLFVVIPRCAYSAISGTLTLLM
jgi:hypothetical protein